MSKKKINVAVIGATGFTGLDLTYYLSKHPKVNIKYLFAQKNIGKKIQLFDKRIRKKLPFITKLKKINWNKIDILFLSLPNGESQKLIKKLFKYKNLKFIDLSADFRIENPKLYKKWYLLNHKAKKLIKNSIYSVSEFTKKKLKNFRIISVPGCYPTSIQLALIPILSKSIIKRNSIVIDSKSGYSGAGKNYKKKFTHSNLDKSVFAYSIEKHRHMSELDQEFRKNSRQKIEYIFNPHLLPTFRGILSSIYLELKLGVSINKVYKELKKFHKNNIFVKILKLNSKVGSGNVLNTNNCEISICKTRIKNKIVIFSAIDNLVKGASGQAIQNMNLAYNFREDLGLK